MQPGPLCAVIDTFNELPVPLREKPQAPRGSEIPGGSISNSHSLMSESQPGHVDRWSAGMMGISASSRPHAPAALHNEVDLILAGSRGQNGMESFSD